MYMQISKRQYLNHNLLLACSFKKTVGTGTVSKVRSTVHKR